VRKIRLVLAIMTLILILPAASWAVGLEVAVGIWKQGPSGTLAFEGDELDLGADFGIDSNESRMMVRAKLDMPGLIPNVYLMGTKMNFNGESTEKYTFGGYDYEFITKTTLELDHYDIALYYAAPFVDTVSGGTLNIELGLNVRLIEIFIEASEALTGHVESESITAAIPMLYGGIQIRPTDAFGIEFEGRGISISGNDYFDAIARVKIKPTSLMFMAAGYRYEKISIDEGDTVIDLTFEGPFLEAGIEF
jgi:outer membrane protein